DDRVDVLPVLLLADVADARRLAALDEVIEAGAPRRPAGLGPVAGAVLEDLAEQLERLARPLRAAERAEVGAAPAVLLAREVHAWEVLVEADADVGVGLVVAEADVEARPVALDEVLLGEQRLRLRLGRDELDVVDQGDHLGRAAVPARVAEVGGDPLADRLRLADVDDPPLGVAEQVDARSVREGPALLSQALSAGFRGGFGGCHPADEDRKPRWPVRRASGRPSRRRRRACPSPRPRR